MRRVDIEKSQNISDLMADYEGWVRKPKMVLCPFHADSNPSAKFYIDTDGIERLYCFSERKQFTSFDYLVLKGVENPETESEMRERKFKQPPANRSLEIDETQFEGFKRGEITLEEFLKRMFEL